MEQDKKKLIEHFLLNEEVMNLVHDHTFKKTEQTNYTTQNNLDFNNTGLTTRREFSKTKNSFLKTANQLFTIKKKPGPNRFTGFSLNPVQRAKTPNITLFQ